ncbi:hypothetical protein Bhyg_00722 [Pseudolycoriella hygida]|uniref:Uncharacterized protein n=1 Tax=Pseudolycoriella hygida TaxID=35572 RepID=A0A9Q0N9J5_9DIPT|nr:hypothetical protein Bhyg_00722 [Pseudolycoriella hygida]
MALRKNAGVDAVGEDGIPSKMWKSNPPGPEQKEPNRMFDKDLINLTDTPAKIRARNQLFMAFPPRTFALHFRTTKAKYRLNALGNGTPEIPELGGMQEVEKQVNSSPTVLVESRLEARNFPHMTWAYSDHVNFRDINFVISEDGMSLSVEYVWPSPLLDLTELFIDVVEEDGSAISMSHPMIYSFPNRVDELDISSKSKPRATLVVNLPLKVQRELEVSVLAVRRVATKVAEVLHGTNLTDLNKDRKNAGVDAVGEDGIPSKMWKSNPPGPEQKEPNRMFDKDLINLTDTPAKIRARNQLFMAFPPRTFALHFRTTKAKYRLNALGNGTPEIPELGGMQEVEKQVNSSPTVLVESRLEARNFPHMTWAYSDHVNLYVLRFR